MELKKNPEKDLRKKTGLFFSIGMVITLSLVVTAFEWKTVESMPVVFESLDGDKFEEMKAPITIQPPPERPKPKPVTVLPEEIIEVEDEVELPEKDFVLDPEDIEPDMLLEDPEPEEDPDIIVTIAEKQPEFAGGMAAFYKFVGKNLKYPPAARRMGIEGRVFVQFVVDKDGSLSMVKVLKGIGGGCDEEAIRVLKNSPKWTPGKQRGRPVRVRMVLPIIFKLQ